MNEYAMIAAIFVVGILIIGMAAFGLYNQTNVLEEQVNDLNVSYAVSENRLIDANNRVLELLQTATNNQAVINQITTQNSTLITDNNILQFNYNVAQQELIDQRVLMEQNIIDTNKAKYDYNMLLLEFGDYNISIDELNESYLDLKDFFFDLRNDFGYCYWALHCDNDENGCQQAYGAVIDANILATLFAANCENISDGDYNTYAAFE